jgi:DNA repair photolyase
MKIRKGFVTNSSSSSFILAFKNDEDFEAFVDKCEEHGYPEVARMVKKIIKRENRSLDEIKKSAQESLYLWKTIDKRNEYIDKRVSYDIPYREKMEIVEKICESEEYKTYISKYLLTTDYGKCKRRIQEAGILIEDTIWDSNGGLLEFAIRNGLLKEWAFDNWFVTQIDVG